MDLYADGREIAPDEGITGVAFHPRILESIEQLDAMILNGDYWTNEKELEAITWLLGRWQRGHAAHLETRQEMIEEGEL